MDIRLTQVVNGHSGDPFAVLGLHAEGSEWVVRTWLPGLKSGTLTIRVIGRSGKGVAVETLHPDGLYVARLPARQTRPPGYECVLTTATSERVFRDPWSFGLVIPEFDLDLFRGGQHHHLDRILGAHPTAMDGIDGIRFAVWAPNAQRVSVVGDWNNFAGHALPMRRRDPSGVWEIFVPGVNAGERYKYEILARDGQIRVKADPVAWHAEEPPATASRIPGPSRHHWQDTDWTGARSVGDPRAKPLAMYEVHANSWWRDQGDGVFPGWRVLAPRIADHALSMGFTHVELLPPAQHPFAGSWGYQVTGQFAPDARQGNPDDLRAFVDHLHGRGLGVIIDFVPGHFPKDDFSLARFDGTPCYEYADPREGEHRTWGTCVYNFRRPEVRNFLLAAALHWCREYHIDGLRVDAVSSMLYRNYDRQPGEWIANDKGGEANEEAASFLRELTSTVQALFPGVLLIAEESTAWQGVTAPVELGGLGFHLKWNMGWMHDSLRYLSLDPIARSADHDRITFHQWYAYDDAWVLPLSHDEVVHGKRSLIDKFPGDWAARRSHLRLLFAWQAAVPGRPLLFQGGEFAMGREFAWDRAPDWQEAREPERAAITACLRQALGIYTCERAMHERDDHRDGFSWVDCDNREESVVAFLRKAPGARPVLAIFNFTPVPRPDYPLTVPVAGPWSVLLNTDALEFAGNGHDLHPGQTGPVAFREHDRLVLRLHLPPLSGLLLAPGAVPCQSPAVPGSVT